MDSNPALPPLPPPSLPGDPLIEERLARLAARRDSGAAGAARAHPAPGRPPSSRRHAAQGSRKAALALSIGTTLGLAGYLDLIQHDPEYTTTASAAGTSTVDTVSADTSTATADTVAAGTTSEAATSTGLADGTYTGDTFTNRWGPVQVEITVTDGLITDVTALQMPDADRKSVSINASAVPRLVAATLAAQSADVDTVSGATYTSDGYRQSLQSALDLAAAASA